MNAELSARQHRARTRHGNIWLHACPLSLFRRGERYRPAEKYNLPEAEIDAAVRAALIAAPVNGAVGRIAETRTPRAAAGHREMAEKRPMSESGAMRLWYCLAKALNQNVIIRREVADDI